MGFLVDTNVLSELRKKKKADVGVRQWYAKTHNNELYVSVLTLGEMRQGIEQIRHRGDVVAAKSLQQWLETVEQNTTRDCKILCVTVYDKTQKEMI